MILPVTAAVPSRSSPAFVVTNKLHQQQYHSSSLASRVILKSLNDYNDNHHHVIDDCICGPNNGLNAENNNDATTGRRTWLVQSSTTVAASILSASTSPSRASAAATIEATKPTSTVMNTSGSSIPSLCDPSVSIWTKTLPNTQQERIIYLLGTAHISTSSADLAGELVRSIKPDAVFVELDAKRVGGGGNVRVEPVPSNSLSSSTDDTPMPRRLAPSSSSSSFEISSSTSAQQQQQPAAEAQSKRSPFDIKGKILDAGSRMVGDSIKGLYKKLGAEGFNPGEEFVVAVKEGLAVGSQIVLGDRDVDVTLRRLTEALSKTDLKKLTSSDSDLEKSMQELLPSSSSGSSTGKPVDPTAVDKESLARYVEVVKAKDNVRLIMKTLQDAAPELYQAMVAERDEYMAKGLNKIDMFPSTVAVMGIAHVDGVERYLGGNGWTNIKASGCMPK